MTGECKTKWLELAASLADFDEKNDREDDTSFSPVTDVVTPVTWKDSYVTNVSSRDYHDETVDAKQAAADLAEKAYDKAVDAVEKAKIDALHAAAAVLDAAAAFADRLY